MITLFVGDVTEDLANTAKIFDSSAFLIENSNFEDFLNSEYDDVCVYTSLGDLPKNISIFLKLLLKADEIFYHPPKVWSDDEMKQATLFALASVSNNKKVHNLPQKIATNSRQNQESQLWIFGSAASKGVGIDIGKTYWELLSTELDIHAECISEYYASIRWTANEIMNSDISENDIIIWELPCYKLVDFLNKDDIIEYSYTNHRDEDRVKDKDDVFQTIKIINQITNFCNKLKTKLIIFDINIYKNKNLLAHLISNPNYHIYINKNFFSDPSAITYIDTSSDETVLLPGPRQHLAYKDFLLNIINSK
jgi:hypothetical protein